MSDTLWWYIWLLKPRNPPFIEKSLFKTGPIKFKIGVQPLMVYMTVEAQKPTFHWKKFIQNRAH